MTQNGIPVGRALRTSNRGFVIGCSVMQPDIPAFGSFVRAQGHTPDSVIYGLVYEVAMEDDPMARSLILADPLQRETILDQQNNRQVIEVSVLAVGYRADDHIVHRIPAHPPVTMNRLYRCEPDEVVAFTQRFDYFRLVLSAPEVPADDLLTASLLAAAGARPTQEREQFLLAAGRELARLLGGDPLRLDGLLRQLGTW